MNNSNPKFSTRTMRDHSVFLKDLHYMFSQTDGTYKFPNKSIGELLLQAKAELEIPHPVKQFAKSFISEKYGQILVSRKHEDDFPIVCIQFNANKDIPGPILLRCVIRFENDENGISKRNRRFHDLSVIGCEEMLDSLYTDL